MIRLAHISFSRPIPIPGTHERLSEFSALDGWTIDDDDGRTWLERGACEPKSQVAVRFYTYVNGSCLPMPIAAPEPAPEAPAPVVAPEPAAKPSVQFARKGKR